MAKTTNVKTGQEIKPTGVLRLRGDVQGQTYGQDFMQTDEYKKNRQNYQVFDPTTKKNYSIDSEMGLALMGKSPTEAKNKFGTVAVDGVSSATPQAKKSDIPEGYQMTPAGVKPIPGGIADPQRITAPSQTEDEVTRKIDEQNQQIEQFRSQLENSGDAFKQGFEAIQLALGEQKGFFEQQLAAIQAQTGMQADLSSKDLQAAVQQAVQGGQTDLTEVITPFLKPPKPEDSPVNDLYAQSVQAGLPQALADEALKAFESGNLSQEEAMAYFGKFTQELPQTPQGTNPIAEVQQQAAPVAGTGLEENPVALDPLGGYRANIVEEQDLTTKISTGLENLTSMSSGSASAFVQGLDLDITSASSAELMQMWLLEQQLDVANDPTAKNFLERSLEKATSAYQEALRTYGEGGTAVREMSKAIEGKDFIPSTYEGLIAKTYTQAKDLQMESIEAEKTYIKEQQDIWMKGETEKRGRLEGYLKAKLYAAGAQDSSAGLAVMALQVNAADLRIQAQNNEYNYAISKLNLQGREAMLNYTNNVVKLTMDTEAKKSEAGAKYSEELTRIEGLFIEDEREKNNLKMSALSSFVEKMYTIDQDRKKEEQYWYEQNYNQVRDTIEDSYKLSGMMGTVYAVDEKGNIFDTGVATFENQKWQDSRALDWARYEHTIEQDSFNRAIDLLDNAEVLGSGIIDSVEQLMGMPAGSLATAKDKLEAKEMVDQWFQSSFTSAQLTEGNWALGEGSPISGLYEDGTVGGQCGYGVRTKFFDLPSMGDKIEDKIRTMDNVLRGRSIKGARGEFLPQVGDMLIQDVGTWTGHVSIVNSVNEDGTITLTETNWRGDEKWTNTRKIKQNDSSIVGIHRGDLKPEIAKMLDVWQGKTAFVNDLEKANLPGGVSDQLVTFINANSKSVKNPFITKSQGYQKTKEIVQGQQFTDQQKSIFNLYESGDELVKKQMESSPGMQMAYFTYKAQQSSNVDGGQKAKDLALIMGKVTGTERREIFNRAQSGGYLEEIQAAEIGDFRGLLGDKAKFTEPLANAGVSSDRLNKIAQKLYSGDDEGAKKDFQLAYVNDVLKTAEPKKDYAGRNQSMATMNELADFITTYENKTGKRAGSAEKIFNFFKTTKDPELQKFKKKVDLAIQSYTQLTSGKAFTDAEYGRYKDNFPNIFSDKELNLSRVRAFHEVLIQAQTVDLNTYTGGYIDEFEDILAENQKDLYLINY